MIRDLHEGVGRDDAGDRLTNIFPENELITNKKTFNYPAELIEL